MRAALYVRTSTADGRQHLENQTRELEEYAAAQKWVVSAVFSDEISGGKGSVERDGLSRMMAAAFRHEFDVVLVSALDRLTREGIKTALHYLSELRRAGVDFRSLREPFFQTAGPMGDLFVSMFAWFAAYETTQLRARIKSGMDRARAEGKQFGRPMVTVNRSAILRMSADGASVRKIADFFSVSRSTVQRIISGGGDDGAGRP